MTVGCSCLNRWFAVLYAPTMLQSLRLWIKMREGGSFLDGGAPNLGIRDAKPTSQP